MGAAVEADQASGAGCGQRRMRLVVGMRPTCSRPTRALFRGSLRPVRHEGWRTRPTNGSTGPDHSTGDVLSCSRRGRRWERQAAAWRAEAEPSELEPV
jgi:hypothetical protein